MKGLSTTLFLVVSAVVMLVTALVIITIFGGGMTQFASISDNMNHCTMTGSSSCSTVGQLPITWGLNNIKDGNDLKSCGSLLSCYKCSECFSDFVDRTGETTALPKG